jgi:hypothetical protein
VKLRITDKLQNVKYPNVSHVTKTKAKRDHIRNIADQLRKTIAPWDQTHPYTMWMQLTSQVTPGDAKDGPPSRNRKKIMLFVDHKTRLVYASFQELKTASETCRSKCDDKNLTKRYQVTIKSYHADNGAFHTEPFQKAIENQKPAT